MPPLLAAFFVVAIGGIAVAAEAAAAGNKAEAAAAPSSCLDDDACLQRLLQAVAGSGNASNATGKVRFHVTDYLAERASPGQGGGYMNDGDTIHIAIESQIRVGQVPTVGYYMPEVAIVVNAAMYAFATGAVLEPPEVYAPFNYNAFILDERPSLNETEELLTLKGMTDLFLGNGSRPPVIAAIGGLLFTESVARTANVFGIPFISFSATQDLLSDRNEFPLFCRFRESASAGFHVQLKFVAHFNYTRVVLMYAEAADKQAFFRVGNEMGFDMAAFQLSEGSNTGYSPVPGSEREAAWAALLRSAKEFNAHVIVNWYTARVPLWDFQHYMFINGLSGKGYLHLGWAACSSYLTDVLPAMQYFALVLKKPSDFTTVVPIDGYFYLTPSQGARWDSHFVPWWEDLLKRKTDVFEDWILDLGGFPSAQQLLEKSVTYKLANIFDAVWAILLATNSLLLEHGPNFTSQELYAKIISSNFEGVSARIKLDEIGELQVDWDIFNCQRCSTADTSERRLNASSNMSVSSEVPPEPEAEEKLPDAGPPDYIPPSPGTTVQIGTFFLESQTISLSAPPVFTGCVSEPPPDLDLPCPVGNFYDRQNAECVTCPAGRFQGSVGRTDCLDCAAGTFSPYSAAEACLACPFGQFAASTRSTTCSECSPGRYIDEVMQKECRNCSAGSFTATFGQSKCSLCHQGEFAVSVGSTTCEVCAGSHYTTKYKGSASADLCVCASGLFLAGEGAECQPCKEGMSCPVGADVEIWLSLRSNASSIGEASYPALLPTYYSLPETPLDVFQCSSDLRCPGGDPGTCGPNLQGVACAHCSTGYEWDGRSCVACITSVQGLSSILAGVALVALPFLIYVRYLFGYTPMSRWGSWRSQLTCIAFVTVSHYSTLQLLGTTNLVLPEPVRASLEAWAFLNEWMSVFRFQCEAWAGFGEITALRLSMPFVIGICALGVYLFLKCMAALLKKPGLAMEPNVLMNCYMSFIYMFFGAISALSMSFFNCYSNPNGLYTLATDRSVVCYKDGALWMSVLAVVIPAFSICVLGSGALFVFAVLRAKTAFADHGFRSRWTFLFIKYRPDVWWWSAVHLSKALLFNLAFSLFPDAALQLYFSSIVMLMYTALVAIFMPYRFRFPSYLDVQASAGLVLVILVMVTCVDSDAYQGLLIRFSLTLHYQPWPVVLVMAFVVVRQFVKMRMNENKLEQPAIQSKQSEFLSRLRQVAFLLMRLSDDRLENFAFHILGEMDQLAMKRFVATIEDELQGHGRQRITAAVGGGMQAERLGQLVSKGTPADHRQAIPGELVWSRDGTMVTSQGWTLQEAEPAEVVAVNYSTDPKRIVLRNKKGEDSAPLNAAHFVFWAPAERKITCVV